MSEVDRRLDVTERNAEQIERTLAAGQPDSGSMYGEILEVLRGRREQVESLRHQLKGAVDVAREIRATTVGVRARFGDGSGLAADMDRWAATLDPSGGR